MMTPMVESFGSREGIRRRGLGSLLLGVLLLVSSQSTIRAQVWTNMGPVVQVINGIGNIRITSVAVDPVNPDRWLVGSSNAGLFETVDAGKTLTPISDSWPTQVVGAITFASSDPNLIYVGTGEPEMSLRSHAGLGMMKSTDGGQTWNLVGASSFARTAVKSIRVHPADANVVVAATVRGAFGRDAQEITPSPAPLGVLRSTDGGLTWVRTLAGLATALEVDPRTFNDQYAGIGDQRVGDAPIPDAAGSVPNGVYRSTNGGQTWAAIAGPWGSSTATRAAMGRIELAIAPSNPDVMYVSMQIPPNGGSNLTGLLGLYRTDNAWASTPSWIKVPTEATSSGNAGHSYCYDAHTGCGAMHVLGVDPLDSNRMFAGGAHANLWLCTNCGLSPGWVNRTSPAGDHHELVWAGNRLINGQDHGLFSTINFGETWESHNAALPGGMFTTGALHPTDPHTVFGALADTSGIYRRTAAGTFRPVFGSQSANLCPGAGEACRYGEANLEISTGRPDTDWALTSTFARIGRTTDGQSWIAADAGIDRTGAAFIAPIEKCPTNDDVFLTGTNRLWRTNSFFSSGAPSWSANSPAHPFQFPRSLAATGTILSIAFAPSEPACNTYAYGNRGGEIRLTTNGGATWRDLDSGKSLPARPINSIAFDPANPDVIFIALSSFDEGTPGKAGHVFRTINAPSASPTWTNISPPDNRPFNVIVIDPRDPNVIYAGSDTGLWYSPNRGTGWQRWGLPSLAVYDLKINPTTNVVAAFTNGRGAFWLDATTAASSGPLLSIPPSASSLSAATRGSYSQRLTATGGKALYNWSVNAGALPPGLTLSPAGTLTGIPISAGTFTFTVAVTDSIGAAASQTYRMNVRAGRR